MGLKDKFISVDRLSQLSDAQLEKLQQAHITTAEELVGQLEADPDGVGELLELDPSEVEKLKSEATTVLEPATRKEFANAKKADKHYAYGALNPHEE